MKVKDLLKNDADETRYLNRIIVILYFFTVIVVLVTGYWNNSKVEDTLKLLIFAIILVSITLFYAKLIHFKLFENKLNCCILIGAYIVSFLFSMVSFKQEVYNLWMIGPILISLIIDTHLGLSFHLLFLFLLCTIRGFKIDEVVVYFILGAIGCLLAKFISDIRKIGYVFLIFISTNITLLILIHNFVYENSLNANIVYSIINNIILIASAYCIYRIYYRVSNKSLPVISSNTKAVIVETEETEEFNLISNDLKTEDREVVDELMRLENLMREEHPLNRKLMRFSPKLYMRSELLGEVCFTAAKKINANARLAGAGAFYHKIGQIVSMNYIEDGIKLLEENNAPQKVINIVAEYHIKYGTPKSVEAAIVMLADSIISSIEVIEKSTENNTFYISKLVDNVVSLRLSKGSLDESGLTMIELKLLKEFFTENLLIIMNQYNREESLK